MLSTSRSNFGILQLDRCSFVHFESICTSIAKDGSFGVGKAMRREVDFGKDLVEVYCGGKINVLDVWEERFDCGLEININVL